jgi:hypothetical protein
VILNEISATLKTTCLHQTKLIIIFQDNNNNNDNSFYLTSITVKQAQLDTSVENSQTLQVFLYNIIILFNVSSGLNNVFQNGKW